MPGKMARSDPRPPYGLSGVLLAVHTSQAVLRKGWKSDRICVRSGFIGGIPGLLPWPPQYPPWTSAETRSTNCLSSYPDPVSKRYAVTYQYFTLTARKPFGWAQGRLQQLVQPNRRMVRLPPSGPEPWKYWTKHGFAGTWYWPRRITLRSS